MGIYPYMFGRHRRKKAPKCTKVVNYCVVCAHHVEVNHPYLNRSVYKCRLFLDPIGRRLECEEIRTEGYELECPHFERKEKDEK